MERPPNDYTSPTGHAWSESIRDALADLNNEQAYTFLVEEIEERDADLQQF